LVIKRFIGLAVCASPSLLYAPGMRLHIRQALDQGATREEISEVLQLASAIAIHTCTYAVPALVEAVKAVEKS
jgi:alkylhydroperoxidase/carboxymuconolactone decarboxylase family protein YurZ